MKRIFVKILRRLGLLRKVNVTVKVAVNGHHVLIPVLNGLGVDNLIISELWMCKLLEKLLQLKSGVFIDVGVNVGQTLIKLRTVSRDADYVGFEPNPLCVYYASELIKANQYTHTKLLPVGLFSSDGILELNMYSADDTDQAASVIENFRPDEKVLRKMYVPVTKFDNLGKMLAVDNISIVKIDVEGAELEVLQSLQPTLQLKRPFVLVEILPAYNASNTARIDRQKQMEELVKTVGYKIFRIIKEDKNTIRQLESLTEIGIHGNQDLCEYLLAPEEQSGTVIHLF